jgi:hypothetical protein
MPIGVDMRDQYFISLKVKYEPSATDGHRSLSWLAPELVHARLALAEDLSDVRTWAGVIDADTLAWLGDAWDLEDQRHDYTFDGVEFEIGGWTPVGWGRLDVRELDAVERQLARVAM